MGPSLLLGLQVMSVITWNSADHKNATLETCGRLWVSTNGGSSFAPTNHHSFKVRGGAWHAGKCYVMPCQCTVTYAEGFKMHIAGGSWGITSDLSHPTLRT